MKMLKTALLTTPILLGLALPVAAASLDERVERMERVLQNQSLLEMLERIDALQQEVQQLRGQLEDQHHLMEGMKTRQRELYLDVDRRMSRLEREGGGVTTAPQTMTTPPATAGTGNKPLTTVTNPTPTTTPVATTNNNTAILADPNQVKQERAAYQKAFDLLRELRYEQASAEFRDFLQKYPNGRYAHIAQYWLGEAAYARRDFQQAIKDYQALLTNHPRSAKRAEAMLKIGYSYQELKKPAETKKIMQQLIEMYPESTEAGQARNQLRRMKKSGG